MQDHNPIELLFLKWSFNEKIYLNTLQEKEQMRRVTYVNAVNSLIYVMMFTRSDIYYVIRIVSKYQSDQGH